MERLTGAPSQRPLAGRQQLLLERLEGTWGESDGQNGQVGSYLLPVKPCAPGKACRAWRRPPGVTCHAFVPGPRQPLLRSALNPYKLQSAWDSTPEDAAGTPVGHRRTQSPVKEDARKTLNLWKQRKKQGDPPKPNSPPDPVT